MFRMASHCLHGCRAFGAFKLSPLFDSLKVSHILCNVMPSAHHSPTPQPPPRIHSQMKVVARRDCVRALRERKPFSCTVRDASAHRRRQSRFQTIKHSNRNAIFFCSHCTPWVVSHGPMIYFPLVHRIRLSFSIKISGKCTHTHTHSPQHTAQRPPSTVRRFCGRQTLWRYQFFGRPNWIDWKAQKESVLLHENYEIDWCVVHRSSLAAKTRNSKCALAESKNIQSNEPTKHSNYIVVPERRPKLVLHTRVRLRLPPSISVCLSLLLLAMVHTQRNFRQVKNQMGELSLSSLPFASNAQIEFRRRLVSV